MRTPLIAVDVPSIYRNNHGVEVSLPKRLAWATPDMADALAGIAEDLGTSGGRLVLSDLFRSFDMQMQAHLDFVTKKKAAFSPPPGGSFHEAGRAMDLSLSDIKIPLKLFWELARKHGVVPIIATPNASTSEAWHFECRGSHQKVIEYYQKGNGNNFTKPYTAGAASAILALGVRVEKFGEHQKEAQIQAALIRCGHVIGNIDGAIGARTRGVLVSLGIAEGTLDDILQRVEDLAQTAFAAEYRISQRVASIGESQIFAKAPEHLDLAG